MDIAAALRDLQQIIDHESTTTAKAARRLAADATAVLEPLRTFVNELDGYLAEAEATAELLGDAEADDREDAYDGLVAATNDLYECLVPDTRLAESTTPVPA